MTETDHEWAARLRASGLPVPEPQPSVATATRRRSPREKVALTVAWVLFVAAQAIGIARHDFGHLTASGFGVAMLLSMAVALCLFTADGLITWREHRRRQG